MEENKNIETNKNPVMFNQDEKYALAESYKFGISNQSYKEGDYSKLYLDASFFTGGMSDEPEVKTPKVVFEALDQVEIYFWKDADAIDTITRKEIGEIIMPNSRRLSDAMEYTYSIPLGEKVGEAIKKHQPEELYAVFMDKDRRTIKVAHIEGKENIDRVLYK